MAETGRERKQQRGALPWILGPFVLALLLGAPARRIGGGEETSRRPAEAGSVAPEGAPSPAPRSGAAGLFLPLEPIVLPAVNPYAACMDAATGPWTGEPACTGLSARHRLLA